MSTQAFEDFDPFDLAHAERHHAVMADMRERCPVARLSSGMIAVTRFADVRATLHEPALRNSRAPARPRARGDGAARGPFLLLRVRPARASRVTQAAP